MQSTASGMVIARDCKFRLVCPDLQQAMTAGGMEYQGDRPAKVADFAKILANFNPANRVPAAHAISLIFSIGLLMGCEPRDPCSDEVGAFVVAQEFIKRDLRSPTTAEFAMISDEGNSSTPIDIDGRCAFLVRTHVDAQNGFGATVRQNFRVVVAPAETKGNWSLVSID